MNVLSSIHVSHVNHLNIRCLIIAEYRYDIQFELDYDLYYVFSLYVGTSKPPNILVVTGRRDSISQWRHVLWNALSRESYVIYELERQDLGNGLWKPYTSLLILDHIEELDRAQKVSVENYLYEGGKALCHCSIYLNRDENGLSWKSDPWHEPLPVSCHFSTLNGNVCLTVMVRKLKETLQSEFRFFMKSLRY